MEALHRRNATGDSRRGIPPFDQIGFIGNDIGSRDIAWRKHTAAKKKREVIAQIRLIRRKRETRRPALNAQMRHIVASVLKKGARSRIRVIETIYERFLWHKQSIRQIQRA